MSDALDAARVDPVGHARRVAYVALQCGRALGWADDELQAIVTAALLHDAGVSDGFPEPDADGSEWWGRGDHCRIGHRLLDRLPPLRAVASVVLYHHTPWDVLTASPVDASVALQANLILLADRVDALAVPQLDSGLLLVAEGIRRIVGDLSGTYLAPPLVDAFLAVSRPEGFWLALEGRHLDRELATHGGAGTLTDIATQDMRALGALFTCVLGAVSPESAEHSSRVGTLARVIGEAMGLGTEMSARLELAGQLHDLGKLYVPAEVLRKPGRLDAVDRAQIARHSYETLQMVRRITGLEDIAAWAGSHHETPIGTGYPFQERGDAVALESRILAVADVFQALAQERAYHAPLDAAGIMVRLGWLAEQQELDPDLVAVVRANLDLCWAAAIGQEDAVLPIDDEQGPSEGGDEVGVHAAAPGPPPGADEA